MTKNKTGWIFFVLRRFNYADTGGRSSVSTLFSVLGIAFGVMVLIVVLAVMNGFQRGYIDTILEVSSGHIRLYGTEDELKRAERLNLHKSFLVFREAQTLIRGLNDRQQGVLIRSVEKDVLKKDPGFAQTVRTVFGSFDLSKENSVVIGYELARQLSLKTGDSVVLVAASGSSQTDIFPENRELTVTGIFKTGYYEVDSSFAFISLESGAAVLGEEKKMYASVKLKNHNRDGLYIASVLKELPGIQAESWRSYNHAFFGALRTEKNMMLVLVVLIFLVVAVNIYNGMRRSIYERREDISVLASMGAHPKHIQFLFIANGFTIGFIGAVAGLLLGLLLSVQINAVFGITETVVNHIMMFFSILTSASGGEEFYIFSPYNFYIEDIPVKIFFAEVFYIFLFGIFSASFAAMTASKRILKLKPAEVLRYE